MALREDFKDEILSSSNPYRTYNIVSSEGDVLYNNVRLNKSYTPQREGSKFGAKELNEICKAINNLVNVIYPVGSIYMSVSKTSPSTLFGGKWEEWGAGRVPVGVDTDQTEFNIVEKTGGKKEQPLRASIGAVSADVGTIGYAATSATPNHNVYNGVIWGNRGDTSTPRPATHATEVWQADGTGPTTVQPYITCYMWKRIA